MRSYRSLELFINSYVSEYNPAYQTPCFSNTSPMHLRSSSTYSDTLCIGLHMLCNSPLPPASAPPHMPPPLVCLFVCLPRIGLHMLHNSASPPASAPPHVPPLLVCLFVCLPLLPAHVLLVLFVCFPFQIG